MAIKCEDQWFLWKLAQGLPACARYVMGQSAISTEHDAVSERMIMLGHVIIERAGNLAVITATLRDGASGGNGAGTCAVFAWVDKADVLGRALGVVSVGWG